MTFNFGKNNGFNLTSDYSVSNPWIIERFEILMAATKEVGDYEIDLSEYLPDDDNDYELLWMFSAIAGNALLMSDGVPFGGVFIPSDSSTRINGILPVTKNRNVKYHVYTEIQNACLSFAAYRKTTNI